jgi:membrane protein
LGRLPNRRAKSGLWSLTGYALLATAFAAGRALFSPEPPPPRNHVGSNADNADHPARPPAKPEPIWSLAKPKVWWSLIRDTASAWMAHKAAKLGAALAYYSVFSLGPLLVIAIVVAGLVFGQEAVRGEVSAQLAGLLGDQGAKGVEIMLGGAGKPRQGIFATLLGAVTLLFAAIGVVVQLKDALNTIWDAKPSAAGSGIWSFVRTYAVSLAGVLSLGFLLLISLLITTALSAMGNALAPYLPEAVFQVVSFVVSFAVISVLFAMMFKWLPDVAIGWWDVIPGAILTAALFEIGKLLIGIYIGKQGLESTYGAAASIVVVLIWVYYSAQLVLFGAEFTRVWAQRFGSATASKDG